MDNLTLDLNKIIKDLKEFLSEAVKRNPYNGLLFSGGLDTSVLARLNPNVACITVSLGAEAEDIPFSKLLVGRLNMDQTHKVVDVDEAIDAVPEVIKILRSFDPAIPNDLVVYFGLKQALELGLDKMATGDASDELFGGYSFMQKIDDLEGYIRRIAETMTYSSNEIGDFLGIDIIQPFTDEGIIDFALKVPRELKIREDNGVIWGKWILRKAFEDILPKELAWQDKRPLEYGSGMTKVRKIISSKISDDEFKEKQQVYPVKFLNKEHLYFYEIYRKVIGEIPIPKKNQKSCPGCGAGLKINAFHCKVCGYASDVSRKGGDTGWRKKDAE